MGMGICRTRKCVSGAVGTSLPTQVGGLGIHREEVAGASAWGVSAHQAGQLVSGRDWRGALGSVSGRLMPSKLRPPVESGVGGHLDWEKPEAGLGLRGLPWSELKTQA